MSASILKWLRRELQKDLYERNSCLRALRRDLKRNETHEAWFEAEHQADWGDGYLVLMAQDTDVRWNGHPTSEKSLWSLAITGA